MKTQQLFLPCRVLCFLLAFLAVTSRPAPAATLPSGFTESPVATGLASPTAMQFAPDGRLFVCEQGGRLRVIKNGTLLSTPFLNVTVSSAGERGLLGVAFDPDFATNHFVYIYYTATSPAPHNRISRFTANGDVAVAGSELVIFELDDLSGATNHNGGALNFGPDRKLYAAVGENANGANAQSMSNVLGKMLRINTDGSIPDDNPFPTATGKNRAIWALGLRNPFTFAFRPSGPEMFINDVGETTWEEINDGLAGANYGWPTTEGMTTDSRFKSPRYAYNHSGGGCAITGGAFYSPLSQQFPSSYADDYFFADYCGGWIRKLHRADNSIANFASGIASPVDLKVSDDGSLYYLARGSGSATGVVFRVQFNTVAPTITTHPASQTVAPGASVTFSVRASGTSPLRYQWRRNSADIIGATSQDYTIMSVGQADNGAMFQALVSNDFGSVFSNQAVLTVSANQAPTATITQPAVGTLYSGGSVINFAGTGTDPEDQSLPASAFTWRVDFHHDTHTHPFMPDTTGISGGSFTIPTMGETSANVWYRIYLTVRDSGGLTDTVQRDVLPRVARLTLATSPAGLQLNLDGQPVATPISFDSVVGIVRNLEATTPQTSGGTTYQFASWSDGGARAHAISTPTANTTYTAAYGVSGGGPRVVSIDFVGSGTAMGPAESAGVVARANWNNATGAARSTPLALVDETGGASAATVTWTSNNARSTPIADQAGNSRMMKGYLNSSATSVTTVTVTGLPAAAYDVYVYADGNNVGESRTAAYEISGAGITTTTVNLTDAANTNFNTAFIQANNSTGNYVKFSGLAIGASGFTLRATPGASSGSRRAAVNAVQIVPTGTSPPPDFTIAVTPGSRTVTPGSSASYTVTVGALNGFAGAVSLAVSGLPANATASFTPPSVTGSGTATLNVTTAAGTPVGNSTLTITGTAAPLSHTATTALIVATSPTAVSIWSASAAPSTFATSDGSAVELGLKFQSDVAGTVTGVRFYKGTTTTGTHTGTLWTLSGTQLASAPFTAETASGWQTVTFSSPVAITANTVYVVSYHTNVGQYAYTYNTFATAGVDNGPLHALRAGVSGGNGVFRYGGIAFPASSFNSSNYWVDVVFVPASGMVP